MNSRIPKGHTKLPDYVSVGQFPKSPLRLLFTAASADALDLLSRMLTYDPRRRCTAMEVSSQLERVLSIAGSHTNSCRRRHLTMPISLLCHIQRILLTSRRHHRHYNLAPSPNSKERPQRSRKGRPSLNRLTKLVNASPPRSVEGLSTDRMLATIVYVHFVLILSCTRLGFWGRFVVLVY